jgi:hypothetical protein
MHPMYVVVAPISISCASVACTGYRPELMFVVEAGHSTAPCVLTAPATSMCSTGCVHALHELAEQLPGAGP